MNAAQRLIWVGHPWFNLYIFENLNKSSGKALSQNPEKIKSRTQKILNSKNLERLKI
jgi:hypothetical protein